MTTEQFIALTGTEIDTLSHSALQAAYYALRAHHLTEMIAFQERLQASRVAVVVCLNCRKTAEVVAAEVVAAAANTLPEVPAAPAAVSVCMMDTDCCSRTRPAPATWVRVTQFAGHHPFCHSCAIAEPDFLVADTTQHWMPISGWATIKGK